MRGGGGRPVSCGGAARVGPLGWDPVGTEPLPEGWAGGVLDQCALDGEVCSGGAR